MDGDEPAAGPDDAVARTLAAYSEAADGFVEKYLDTTIAARFGDEFRRALAGDRVLDVGCGPGADAATFAADGLDVTGVDLTPALLRTARERVPAAGFLRGDMRRLPVGSNAVDGVWCCAALLHVPRPQVPATLAEFGRVLVDDGVLFTSVMAGDDGGYHRDGRYFERYRAPELREFLEEAGFGVEALHADADGGADGDADADSGPGWLRAVARW